MCGRFTQTQSIPKITQEFGVAQVACDLGPSYNIAPTQKVAVIITDGVKQLVPVRWGLVPSWAKDISTGSKMINARAETVTEKASYKNAFKKRRCLVVADGFYEWQDLGGTKRPVYIRLRSGKPFGFAGLYEFWTSPEGEAITTCTIITTEANEIMKPIHERMPVIIPKRDEDVWLDPATQDESLLLKLLKPYPAEEMEAYPVSKRVNSPKNNTAACIEQLKLPVKDQ
ncbi:MAG TPA: SOS response-associated peptidase [Blastocatellia bacterium]|nr:SOS response-associated peptidase [Blastocatellia bacterium]